MPAQPLDATRPLVDRDVTIDGVTLANVAGSNAGPMLVAESVDLGVDLSALIGERDEITDSVTIGEQGHRSAQRSIRRVAIMPPDVIRTLPFGIGVVMLRTARPIITDLRAWPARKDATQLKTDRKEIEALLHTS